MFSESLKKEAASGSLSWSSKSELLKIMAEEILKYTSNPSPSQRDIVARELIKMYPNLKSNIGEGYEGWAQKLYDRVKNEARKRSIFSHKRKLFKKKDSTLKYSPKVQKTLSHQPTEDSVANLEVKEKMLFEMRKMPGSRCVKVIQEGLKITYKERRSAINSNTLMGDLKNMFPALFTVFGIQYDFNVLYNIDLEKAMFTSLQACSSAVEAYAKKKRKGESLINVPISENIKNKVIRTILLIPKILGEDSDFLYKEFPSETSMLDLSDTHVTPHLCLVGDPFSTSEVYVVAEKKNLIECKGFIEGIVTLIGLYFVINIEYPKQAMATFKFFQSYILQLHCKNLPGKLITFCKALS